MHHYSENMPNIRPIFDKLCDYPHNPKKRVIRSFIKFEVKFSKKIEIVVLTLSLLFTGHSLGKDNLYLNVNKLNLTELLSYITSVSVKVPTSQTSFDKQFPRISF